jgi:hypothetical protein
MKKLCKVDFGKPYFIITVRFSARKAGNVFYSVTCLQAVYQYHSLVEARDNEKILVEAFVTHDNESKLKRRQVLCLIDFIMIIIRYNCEL